MPKPTYHNAHIWLGNEAPEPRRIVIERGDVIAACFGCLFVGALIGLFMGAMG